MFERGLPVTASPNLVGDRFQLSLPSRVHSELLAERMIDPCWANLDTCWVSMWATAPRGARLPYADYGGTKIVSAGQNLERRQALPVENKHCGTYKAWMKRHFSPRLSMARSDLISAFISHIELRNAS